MQHLLGNAQHMAFKLAIFPDEHTEIPFSEMCSKKGATETRDFGLREIVELGFLTFLFTAEFETKQFSHPGRQSLLPEEKHHVFLRYLP